jgi:hypothetical protein
MGDPSGGPRAGILARESGAGLRTPPPGARDAMTAAEAFLDDYRKAFALRDAEALVERFAFPLQTVSVTEREAAVAVSTRDEWRRVIDRLLEAYAALGAADAAALEIDVAEPLPRVASVRVRWKLRRSDGSAIYDFTALYSLAQIGGRMRIVAIAHDEASRLQEALRGHRPRPSAHVAGVAEGVAPGLRPHEHPVRPGTDRDASDQPAAARVDPVDLGVVAPGDP